MKKLFLIALVFPLLFSCSKKEGCNDRRATNYDEMVVVDDGTCNYTNLTFFADTTHINGIYITNIDIEIENISVSSFNGMHMFGPGSCGSQNTGSFATGGEESVAWTSIISLNGGGLLTSSGVVDTRVNQVCVMIHVLP